MNALYTTIENGRESYFGTDIADGFGYPFIVYNYAVRMAKALNENGALGTVGIAEMLPLMKANEEFRKEDSGYRIFYPISEIVFAEREAEMSTTDYISFNITLDFDKRKIGFVFNRNCPELPMPKIEIPIGNMDAREVFGKENPIMSAERFYRNKLESSVLESPVFLINLQSDKIDFSDSVLLPLSNDDQMKIAEELRTERLDNCKVISITAFESALKVYYLNGQPFSRLNELASELNRLRLDCGDNAFNSFVKANKIAPFCDADSALAAVDSIRKSCALQENQGMDIKM